MTQPAGCQGYDNCWIYDKSEEEVPGLTLWSDLSGIRSVSAPAASTSLQAYAWLCALQRRECRNNVRLDVTTNNPAVQVYTAYWLDTPRKQVHGGPSLNYTKWSAVAIEQEGYIDAINTPEWDVDQICEPQHSVEPMNNVANGSNTDYPGRDFHWDTKYKFSTVD